MTERPHNLESRIKCYAEANLDCAAMRTKPCHRYRPIKANSENSPRVWAMTALIIFSAITSRLETPCTRYTKGKLSRRLSPECPSTSQCSSGISSQTSGDAESLLPVCVRPNHAESD